MTRIRGRRATPGDEGASLTEILVVLVLATLLVQAAWSVLGGQVRATRRLAQAAERLDAARVGRYVLGQELRAGRPGRDWTAPAGDSTRLRAFRGLAVPCSSDAPGDGVLVRYRGVRRPDPAKDSLLLLLPEGRWAACALEAATPASDEVEVCPEAGREWSVQRWRIEDPGPEIVVARLFEPGSYHVAGGALRYRRGAGGRQPLTPVLLHDPTSGLEAGDGNGAFTLRFTFRGCRPPRCGPPWVATLRSTAP